MTGLRSVVAVHDHHQTWELLGANNPAAGVLVVQVTPDLRRSHELGQDILAALGKRDDVSGAGRHADIDWDVLTAWLLAYPIRHLILVDTQWLPTPLYRQVAELAAVTDLECWLVAQEPVADRYVELVAEWPHVTATVGDLLATVSRPVPAAQPGAASFPQVPEVNFTTFLADCHRLLHPDEAAVVNARFCEVAHRADAWLAEAELTELDVVEHLRKEVNLCSTVDEMLVAVRAVQARAFEHDWLIQVELSQLLATADTAPNAAIRSPETWRRLAVYREPYRGAACALAAAELSITEMQTLSLADINANGSSVTIERDGPTTIHIPSGAEVYLRAQRVLRQIEGADTSDRLFANEDGPMRDRYIVYALRAPITEVGVAVISGAVQRQRVDSKRWANRWGVSVQSLG